MTNLAAVQNHDREAVRERLMAAVDSIRDVIADCADEAESIGTYPERGWRAMHEAGLFNMKAPAELGGAEADPLTQIEVLTAVAEADTSAGWTLFVGAGNAAIFSGWLPDAALDEFMIDGRLPRVACAAAPSGRATPVKGGYRVTGRWSFASGCKHAEWIGGSAIIEGDGHVPPMRCFAFPARDVTIHDNWDVNGLRGTGSCDFSVDDVFVPAELAVNLFSASPRPGALYKIGLPWLSINEHGSFAIGVARRAVHEMTELAMVKSASRPRPEDLVSRERFQFDLGRAEIALDAASALHDRVHEELWAGALDGLGPDAATKVRLQSAAVHATEVALEVTATMFRYAGAHALFTGNVIERCMRDARAGAQHRLMSLTAYEAHGRNLLNIPHPPGQGPR